MPDRELIYTLLRILGRMEVDKGGGVITVWAWDYEKEKPVRIS